MSLKECQIELAQYRFSDAYQLKESLSFSSVTAQVLARRGYTKRAEVKQLLNDEELPPVKNFADLRGAVELAIQHLTSSSKIVVHGDYDVDGVCATALLVRTLKSLGGDVETFIPDRVRDGYGLNEATINRLSERGAQLLITVDCGITAVSEVDLARSLGIDVIITDHHSPSASGDLPDALIVHPSSPPAADFTDLCGAAVAYRFCQALLEKAGVDSALVERDLDLVALATVADVMPLVAENRILVKQGLQKLSATDKPGLLALMREAKVDPTNLSSTDIAFRLAPRINAAGRLYHADAALELLLTTDSRRAGEIAGELERINGERKFLVDQALIEAESQIKELGPRSIYVLASDQWHPGVLGIVAAKLAERYLRPAVLITFRYGDPGSGSARSVPGFNILEALTQAASELIKYGGHSAAAGLQVTKEGLERFRQVIEAVASEHVVDALPIKQVDAVASVSELTLELAEELARLGPFGAANPEVTLLLPAVKVLDQSTFGGGKHLRCTLAAGSARVSAVAFGVKPLTNLKPDETIDIICRLERNQWGGVVEPRLLIEGVAARARHATLLPPDDCAQQFIDDLLEELEGESDRNGLEEVVSSLSTQRDVVVYDDQSPVALLYDLNSTGSEVLVVCADLSDGTDQTLAALSSVTTTDYLELERGQLKVADYEQVVAASPPTSELQLRLLKQGDGYLHLLYGEEQLRSAYLLHEHGYNLTESLRNLYRTIDLAGEIRCSDLEELFKSSGATRGVRVGRVAGRMLRVLLELGLLDFDRQAMLFKIGSKGKTSLSNSETFNTYQVRYQEGIKYLQEKKTKSQI